MLGLAFEALPSMPAKPFNPNSANNKAYLYHFMNRLSLLLIIALGVTGCAGLKDSTKLDFVSYVHKPVAVKLGDNHWVLKEPLTYEVKTTGHSIVVPKGFITDLASTPRILWAVGLSPIDSYMAAAIVHDYLYWNQRCSRSEADDVLSLAMEESNVPPVQRYLVYQGVNLFGLSSWKENALLRERSEQRYLTESYTDYIVRTPVNTSESLQWLQKDARLKNGLKLVDESNPKIVSACKAASAELAKL